MKLSTTFYYLLILTISTSCSDAQEYREDSHEVVVKESKDFGILKGMPSSFKLDKYTILDPNPTGKYPGGSAFASICKKNVNDYLVVAMGYGKYDDFAFSELLYFDLNIQTKQFTVTSLFQENLSKIQTGGNSLVKLNDKVILSLFYGKESANSINIYMKSSGDNGVTWSGPKMISTLKDVYQHAANNRAILLSSGRILLPMAIGGAGSKNYIFCYYSDDNGDTWQNTKLLYTKGNSLYEPCVEELSDGRLIMTLRNSSGKIIFAFSNDDGLTWTDFVKSDITSPDAPSTIAKIPGKNLLVLIWNNTDRIFDYHNRSPLSLAISKDEGKTWKYLFDIENTLNVGAYYPTINFSKDKMLITYTKKNVNDSRSVVVFSEVSIPSLEDLLNKAN